MENKINIAELLKDCPEGMELDCILFDDDVKVIFDGVDGINTCASIIRIVVIHDNNRISHALTKYGQWNPYKYAKCVIFPKGKTTWEGFVPPCEFKDGDIITCNNSACTFVSIFKDKPTEKSFQKHCSVILDDNKFFVGIKYADYANPRFATEEEKAKLFKSIRDNGYKWNPETKTLEKLIGPNFHEGDWIACEELNTAKILSINMDRYEVEFIDGNKGFPHIDYIDRNFHLWTIQDAKDGDILAFNDETIVIFKDLYNKTSFHSYCHIEEGIFTISKKDMPDWWEGKGFYPATEEQRTFLFRKIKEAGYKWNYETKTLEKVFELKFQVGDRVQNKNTNMIGTINLIINDEREYQVYLENGGITYILFEFQDNWELVPNKFDITTLKPFDKVLVRDHNAQEWVASLFSNYNEPKKYKYICVNGSGYAQCIPYEGNEHLLGTKNNCDDYHKTWE